MFEFCLTIAPHTQSRFGHGSRISIYLLSFDSALVDEAQQATIL
jgi:hypothetical protein